MMKKLGHKDLTQGQVSSPKPLHSVRVTMDSYNQTSSEAVVWRPKLGFSQRGKRRAGCRGKEAEGCPSTQGPITRLSALARGL